MPKTSPTPKMSPQAAAASAGATAGRASTPPPSAATPRRRPTRTRGTGPPPPPPPRRGATTRTTPAPSSPGACSGATTGGTARTWSSSRSGAWTCTRCEGEAGCVVFVSRMGCVYISWWPPARPTTQRNATQPNDDPPTQKKTGGHQALAVQALPRAPAPGHAALLVPRGAALPPPLHRRRGVGPPRVLPAVRALVSVLGGFIGCWSVDSYMPDSNMAGVCARVCVDRLIHMCLT